MNNFGGPVVLTHEFPYSMDRVWSAITNYDEMLQWYFQELPAFVPEVGFETEFVLYNEGRKFTHEWKILEVEPPRLIVYKWSFKEYPGDSRLSFILTPVEDACHLKLVDEVMEDFPDDIPEFKRESCEAGWKFFIHERLANYLNPDKQV